MYQFSDRSLSLQAQLQAFMDEHIYPNEKAYHGYLASAHIEVGDTASAKEHLRQAIDLDPNNPEHHGNLGYALATAGRAAAASALSMAKASSSG